MGFFELEPSPILAALKAAGHHGIHNFTIGTLTTYFRLETAQASFEDGVLVLDGLPGSARRKVFVYRGATMAADQLAALQATSVIYSIDKLPLAKQSKFKELAYDLPGVFDPASYPNARKRHKRLLQPVQRLSKEGVEVRSLLASDLLPIGALHRSWCDWKLAQPTTHRMLFPKQRYINCMKIAISRPAEYIAIGAFSKFGEILAARALYIDGSSAFDLANFAATWGAYSNFTEDFAIAGMQMLRNNGITYLNCGATLDKRLGAFKSHWPHFYIDSWAYGKI